MQTFKYTKIIVETAEEYYQFVSDGYDLDTISLKSAKLIDDILKYCNKFIDDGVATLIKSFWFFKKMITTNSVYEGIEYYEKGIREITLQAKKGDARAQCLLGDFYYFGYRYRVIPKEPANWYGWYKKSGNMGFAPAQFRMGYLYENWMGFSYNDDGRYKWNHKAVTQKYAPAQFKEGEMYYAHNREKISDTARYAFNLFLDSSTQGYKPSKEKLAQCYYEGYGTHIDYEKSFTLFLELAKQDCKKSQYRIGLFYLKGLGVEKNYFEAAEWFKKSNNKKYGPASYELAALYDIGLGVRKNTQKAALLYQSAKNNESNVDDINTRYLDLFFWG